MRLNFSPSHFGKAIYKNCECKTDGTGNVAVDLFIYLLFYVAFNSQGHIAAGSLQVEETSAYCTVNHRASANNY